MKQRVILAAAALLIATTALASWYDDYDAGIAAVRKGQWQVVIQKMTAAISGNGAESNNARTYGNIFINYHPYYYRGLAYMRTGQYAKAISDFEKTQGPGEIDRGSIDELMQEAKSKQAAGTTPEPQPQPVPVPVPQPPAMDPALRQQVVNAINAANQSLAAARSRNAAASNEYRSAIGALAQANDRIATAKSNEDLQAALASANNAKLFADSAVGPNIPTPTPVPVPVPVPTPTPNPIHPPLPPVFDEYKAQLRRALQNYFEGDFETASRDFGSLSQKLPTNGWIWAFLGASQYSQYAFEADETYRDAALKSFKKAKQYRSWKGGLPPKYFSRRIRTAFEKS